MNYKYRRGQIFGKQLPVPDEIKEEVYSCTISIEDYLKYKLDQYGVPISCLMEFYRKIVEKTGIEKAKTLDWKHIEELVQDSNDIYEAFLNFDSQLGIDATLEAISKKHFTEKEMRRIIDMKTEPMRQKGFNYSITMDYADYLKRIIKNFNKSNIAVYDIIANWEIFKDKDVTQCLLDQYYNDLRLSINDIERIVANYEPIIRQLKNMDLLDPGANNVYNAIRVFAKYSFDDRDEMIAIIVSSILNRTGLLRPETPYYYSSYSNDEMLISLSNEEYVELFSYPKVDRILDKVVANFDNYFNIGVEGTYRTRLEFLKKLSEANIPLPLLNDKNVADVIHTYGLERIIEFNRENDNFFTRNDCEVLINFSKNTEGWFDFRPYEKRSSYDRTGKVVEYEKSEFDYAMKMTMIKCPKMFRGITGKFKEQNPDFFLDPNAPKELQDMFYTGTLTIDAIKSNPKYLDYLVGKSVAFCFEEKNTPQGIDGPNISFYHYLATRYGNEAALKFALEYDDVLNMFFAQDANYTCPIEIEMLDGRSLEDIKRIVGEVFAEKITTTGQSYPKNIPQAIKDKYPNLFPDLPDDLKEKFYSKKLSYEEIAANRELLKNVDLNLIFKPMYVPFYGVNFVTVIKDTYKEDAIDVMLSYGKYLYRVYSSVYPCSGLSREVLTDRINLKIAQLLFKGEKYDDNMAESFKKTYPEYFPPKDIDENLRKKFFDRSLDAGELLEHRELIDQFGSTNIALGFVGSFSWTYSLYKEGIDPKQANYNRIRIINEYVKINDSELQGAFLEFIKKNQNLDLDTKLDKVVEVLRRLKYSNSSEMSEFKGELARQILEKDDPYASLEEVEGVFVRNNLPTIGKVYSCFNLLHPGFYDFDFEKTDSISPTLKKLSTRGKQFVTFADLLRASLDSNNKSMREYLDNMERSSKIYNEIRSGEISYTDLNQEDKQELDLFSRHLVTLYNSSLRRKMEGKAFEHSGDTIETLNKLYDTLIKVDGAEYDLGDRAVAMFCEPIGLTTVKEARDYMRSKLEDAERRRDAIGKSRLTLERGDLIKGIVDIQYLGKTLQNGCLAKEFLGIKIESDYTPLDTDVSMVLSNCPNLGEQIHSTFARAYGPIWVVLKNGEERFNITRTFKETRETSRDVSRPEKFNTGVGGKDAYGDRTGFGSGVIDCIVVEKEEPRVYLEIAMNGCYIPVADINGNIIFTREDYNKMREKMAGLSYYGTSEYHLSKNLESIDIFETKEQCESDFERTDGNIAFVRENIREALEKAGIPTAIDGFSKDLSPNVAEIYSTGSTARNTNVPGDSDYDYLIKIDSSIYSNPELYEKFKRVMKEELGLSDGFGGKICGTAHTPSGEEIDIEISFCQRTDKVEYSTDAALKERLDNIKAQYPNQYDLVVANIVRAKQVLKQAGAYKSAKSDATQGGLGGIGIENWVLQHGGSFIDAAVSFVSAADKYQTFDEFRRHYHVFDMGSNHYSDKSKDYPHEDFVYEEENINGVIRQKKMTREGFEKTTEALKTYLKTLGIDYHDMIGAEESDQEHFSK